MTAVTPLTAPAIRMLMPAEPTVATVPEFKAVEAKSSRALR